MISIVLTSEIVRLRKVREAAEQLLNACGADIFIDEQPEPFESMNESLADMEAAMGELETALELSHIDD